MHNRKLKNQITRLRNIIDKTRDACEDDLEIQSHWAKYICIISAGFLENSIKEIYTEYAANQVSQPIANFIAAKLAQIRNPKASLFLETAAAFRPIWKDELENFLLEEERGNAIDSIINNRHLIAHGKENQSGITVSRVKDWLDKAIEVMEFIETQCRS
ncbi:MAG: HEPN domain-containing protein [Calothrix sp. MO_167.B42]|nr:HEPN domain-containing protein [Calothrix sp. MO_167.B42]